MLFHGPDIELVGWGDEWYADYETPDGYSVIYDDSLGLFAYAKVVDGRFQSTGVAASEPPPPGIELHARESPEVRQQRVAAAEDQRLKGHAGDPPDTPGKEKDR